MDKITSNSSAALNDENAILNAVEQFYSALNLTFTGDIELMNEVWSHADDVTYMGPQGGFQVGWEKVLEIWKEHTAMHIGGIVKPTDMQITLGQDIAITHNYEKGENTSAKGEPQKVSIRATNIFRKEGEKWKMIGHHTDILPFLEK